jgi:hypothetical protein
VKDPTETTCTIPSRDGDRVLQPSVKRGASTPVAIRLIWRIRTVASHLAAWGVQKLEVSRASDGDEPRHRLTSIFTRANCDNSDARPPAGLRS